MATGEGASLGHVAAALRQRHSTWRVARAVFFLFNLHTLVVCACTCAFTWLCAVRGWSYDVDSQLFVIAINFPLTFALTQAFTRRERALTFIAELKGSCCGLFFAYRDWPQVFPSPSSDDGIFGGLGGGPPPRPPAPSWPRTLGDNENPWAREARAVLVEFLAAVRDYLSAPCGFESVGEARLVAHQGHGHYLRELLLGGPSLYAGSGGRGSRARQQRLLAPSASLVDRVREQARGHPGHGALVRAYEALSRLHVLNEHLSQAARYGRGAEGSVSRAAQYVRFLSCQWEQVSRGRCMFFASLLSVAARAPLSALFLPFPGGRENEREKDGGQRGNEARRLATGAPPPPAFHPPIATNTRPTKRPDAPPQQQQHTTPNNNRNHSSASSRTTAPPFSCAGAASSSCTWAASPWPRRSCTAATARTGALEGRARPLTPAARACARPPTSTRSCTSASASCC